MNLARLAKWVLVSCTVAGVLVPTAVVATLELSALAGDFPRDALLNRDESIRILARDGSLLRETLSSKEVRSRWVGLGAVSPKFLEALLAAEDAFFAAHHGIDYRALLRATWHQATGRRSGGSTISQQVVKLLVPRPRTFATKWSELVLALRLERALPKEEILRQYINRAPFGAREVGVEAGAQALFNKPARDLSLAEAALLAGLPKAPSAYDPRKHPKRALSRRAFVLRRMEALGLIGAVERSLAEAQPLAIAAERPSFEAPHFAQRVLQEEKETHAGVPIDRGLLAGAQSSRDVTIHTSLDPRLQRRAEVLVQAAVASLKRRGGSQAAAIVIENATGAVLAYVGSADWHDAREGKSDAVHARRQPGSALKPFAYALAFEGDLTAASQLVDLPAHFTTANGEYSPRNYDARFHGPVLAREALANSYNVPAVRVAHALSPGALLARLRALGFVGLAEDLDHYGLGLVLGNGEVSLFELGRAYLALARGGERIEPTLRARAGDRRGRRDLREPHSARVFSSEAAYLVTDVLSDRHARKAAFGESSALDLPFVAAVKTGTSTDFRDNWTAGYTTEVTVAVWVGNFSGKPMRNVSGVTGAAPLWNELIEAAMEGRPRRAFERPAGIDALHVCARSGLLAGPQCGGGRRELFRAGTAPRQRCDVHVVKDVDRRNGLLAGPACKKSDRKPMRGESYAPELVAWAADAGRPLLPRAWSPRCPAPITSEGIGRVEIKAPRDGDVLTLAPDLPRRAQRLALEAVVDGAPRALLWYVDGQEVASAKFPYRARWKLEPGEHELVAEADGVRSDPVRVTIRP